MIEQSVSLASNGVVKVPGYEQLVRFGYTKNRGVYRLALTAYGPDTVVQAGDGAGVKLEYQRDVNLVIKNLEDAIASMTTT